MNSTKGALKSASIWGSIIAALGLIVLILNNVGVQITGAEAEGIVQNLESIIASILSIYGTIQAVIGRSKAKHEISGLL